MSSNDDRDDTTAFTTGDPDEHHGAWDTHPEGPDDTITPAGPSWPTVTLGVVCLAVAAAVLGLQLVDVSVDWAQAGPLAVAGIGALVALVGAVGVVLGGRR